MTAPSVLITGGAGFIGTNLAFRLAREGRRVVVLDNLSRAGVGTNLAALRAAFPDRVSVVLADVREADVVAAVVAEAGAVVHLAAQVAVTTSLVNPLHDFQVNVLGTLNLLEAVRACRRPPPLVFASTNKVYGRLDDLTLASAPRRVEPSDPDLRRFGVSENRPLSFISPYGCSKGAADQYVLDYARSFGIPATVFRLSCVYGPYQCGTEDQGWVAHFLLRAIDGRPITLYGDGRQVRDVLHVDDAADAIVTVLERMDLAAGKAFNLGGGPDNAASLLEMVDGIDRLAGYRPEVLFGPTRMGDQPWYVADSRCFQGTTGWRPKVSLAEGVDGLFQWLSRHRSATARAAAS
ncbi:MAG TPA: SDR family NAD(P)-dependent oxidoreductase [Azospirillaceae bacterium]|nr:SDR family NAD(P)-dependent oxidoreductase [Azospirillaceae bacterium]